MKLQIIGALIVTALSIGVVAKEPVKLAQAKPEQDKKQQKQSKPASDSAEAKLLASKGRKLIIGETVSEDRKQCFPFC